MSANMERYVPLAQFIAELMGPDTEVILYDARERRVCQVLNPMDEEMTVGSEMRALERSFLESRVYERENFIVNYRALSKQKNKLKSATFFLRDEAGGLTALMTVNCNVDRLVELRDLLNVLVSGQQPYEVKHKTSFYNSFDVSIEGMVSGAIREELDRYAVPPERLSQREKMEVVRNLDQKGVFLVKGAISELAAILQTTETTVYRYLGKLSARG